MIDREAISKIVFDALVEFREQSDGNPLIANDISETLFGKGGSLDSLGLVNLITMIEERMDDEHSVVLTLADDKAMSREKSPFRSVGNLIDYLCEIVKEPMLG